MEDYKYLFLLLIPLFFNSCASNNDVVLGVGDNYNNIKVLKEGKERLFRFGSSIYWAVKIPEDSNVNNIAIRLDKRSLGWINIENRNYPLDKETSIASGVYEGLPYGNYRMLIRIRNNIYGPFFFSIFKEEK